LFDRAFAIGVVEAYDVYADAFQVTEKGGGLRLLFGRDLGRELEHSRGKIDFNELAFGSGHELTDVDVTGFGFGSEGLGGQGRGKTGGDYEGAEGFHEGWWIEVG
jgi:hypothetical protein